MEYEKPINGTALHLCPQKFDHLYQGKDPAFL